MPQFIGTAGADLLEGGPDGDVIHGLDGDDVIRGFAGDDILDGGSGNDTLDGGAGDDSIFYDEADNFLNVAGGDGLDTLIIYNALGVIPYDWLDLAAQGFEYALFVHAGSVGPAATYNLFTAQWSQISSTAVQNDGSRTVYTYNYAPDVRWAVSRFDPDGNLTQFELPRLDGSLLLIEIATGGEDWAQRWFQIDTRGRTDAADVIYESGAHTFINFDQDNTQNWSEDWFSYDALGRLDSEDVLYDNGTRTFINLDQDNSQIWDEVWFSYDAQGRLDAHDVLYDDGSRIFYNHDQANAESFELTALLYNSSGTAYQQIINWDDGSSSYYSL